MATSEKVSAIITGSGGKRKPKLTVEQVKRESAVRLTDAEAKQVLDAYNAAEAGGKAAIRKRLAGEDNLSTIGQKAATTRKANGKAKAKPKAKAKS